MKIWISKFGEGKLGKNHHDHEIGGGGGGGGQKSIMWIRRVEGMLSKKLPMYIHDKFKLFINQTFSVHHI